MKCIQILKYLDWPGEFHGLYSPWGRKEPDMTDWLSKASLVAQLVKNLPACNEGDLGSIPGLGRSPGERKGYPLQYSVLDNSLGCIVHEVAKCWTWLGHFCFQDLYYWIFIPPDLLSIQIHDKGYWDTTLPLKSSTQVNTNKP